MRKILALVALAIALHMGAFVPGSASGLEGRFALGGFGTVGMPVGDFADENKGAAKTGFGFAAQLEYYPSDNFSFGASFSYPTFGTKTKDFEAMMEYLLYLEYGEWYHVDADLQQKLVSFGIFGKYLFTPYSTTCFYLKAGAGIGKYSLTGDIGVDFLSMDADASFDSKFFVNLGPGIQYRTSESVALIIEVTYINAFTDETEGDLELKAGPYAAREDVELDFNTQYFGIYAGVCFFFGGQR